MVQIIDFNPPAFTPESVAALDAAIDLVEKALSGKILFLDPDERTKFGSVNEKNKLIINKVKEFFDSQPELSSADVNWERFMQHYNDRQILESRSNKLRSILENADSAKIMHDYSNYQDSLTDYGYVKYKISANAKGYQVKYAELKQFFLKSSSEDSTKGTSNGAGNSPEGNDAPVS